MFSQLQISIISLEQDSEYSSNIHIHTYFLSSFGKIVKFTIYHNIHRHLSYAFITNITTLKTMEIYSDDVLVYKSVKKQHVYVIRHTAILSN